MQNICLVRDVLCVFPLDIWVYIAGIDLKSRALLRGICKTLRKHIVRIPIPPRYLWLKTKGVRAMYGYGPSDVFLIQHAVCFVCAERKSYRDISYTRIKKSGSIFVCTTCWTSIDRPRLDKVMLKSVWTAPETNVD